MTERNFFELLEARMAENKFVCVGLDSDAGKIPIQHLDLKYDRTELLDLQKMFVDREELSTEQYEVLAEAVVAFNQDIVDATCDVVLAYKLNSAFYEALGAAGMWALKETITYIHDVAPGVPVIIDCKRADIGSTNDGYAQWAFDLMKADAITVHPYLGSEAIKPFLDRRNKGIIVLCRTSNPGAGELQDPMIEVSLDSLGEGLAPVPNWLKNLQPTVSLPLYKYIAHQVTHRWNYNRNCAVVVGATYPEQLAEVRKIVGDMVGLLPGIGAQGGELEATVKAGVNSKGHGMIINNSRQAIFASSGPNFPEAARTVVVNMNDHVLAVLALT